MTTEDAVDFAVDHHLNWLIVIKRKDETHVLFKSGIDRKGELKLNACLLGGLQYLMKIFVRIF